MRVDWRVKRQAQQAPPYPTYRDWSSSLLLLCKVFLMQLPDSGFCLWSISCLVTLRCKDGKKKRQAQIGCFVLRVPTFSTKGHWLWHNRGGPRGLDLPLLCFIEVSSSNKTVHIWMQLLQKTGDDHLESFSKIVKSSCVFRSEEIFRATT